MIPRNVSRPWPSTARKLLPLGVCALLCAACQPQQQPPAPGDSVRTVVKAYTVTVVRTQVITAAPPREAAAPPAPAPAPATLTTNVIALVDGKPVYVDEFARVFDDQELEALPGYVRREYDRNRQEFINQLIANAVFARAAAEQDYSAQPEVQRALDDAADRIRMQYFYEQQIGSQTSVGDDEVQQYYQQHTDEFTAPERVRARHILIEVPANAYPAEVSNAWQKIHLLQRRAQMGEPFAELAAAFSMCPSRARGGDLGYFEHGQMVPEFEKVAFALKKNEISSVVKTEFGYHIIQLLDRIPERRRGFEEVREEIRDRLMQEREQQVYQHVLSTLTNRYPVQRNETVIQELVRDSL
jgi:hypothetical protein